LALARIARAFTIPQPNETVPASTPAQLAGPLAGAFPSRRPTTALRRSLRASLLEGAVAEVFGALATGSVTTAWALYFGAGPAVFGLLGALPLGAQLVNLPITWFTEHVNRKRLTIWAVSSARLIYLPLPLLLLLPIETGTKLSAFVAVVGASTVLGVAGNNAWTAWMGDLVPQPIRGRFFGRRTVFVSVAGTLASLAAGLLLDWRRNAMASALTVLTIGACLAGLVSISLLLRQMEPRRGEGTRARLSGYILRRIVADPFVRPFIRYQIAWNAAVAISASFFSFHMLTNLHTGFLVVATHGVVVAAVRIASAQLWGRAVDRVGARPVIVLCSFGISVGPLVWFLVTPDRLWPIGIEAVTSGLFWAGHGIAGADLVIDIAPRARRSLSLAVIATAAGLGFALSSLAAGRLASVLPSRLDTGDYWLTGIHVLFLLSALARAAAALLALRIEDPGAQGGVREVLRFLAWALRPALSRRAVVRSGARLMSPPVARASRRSSGPATAADWPGSGRSGRRATPRDARAGSDSRWRVPWWRGTPARRLAISCLSAR
jgi:MFS family permease